MKKYFKLGLLVGTFAVLTFSANFASAAPTLISISPRHAIIGQGNLEITGVWSMFFTGARNHSLAIDGTAAANTFVFEQMSCTGSIVSIAWLSNTTIRYTCSMAAIKTRFFPNTEMAGCHDFRIKTSLTSSSSNVVKSGFVHPAPRVSGMTVAVPLLPGGIRQVTITGSGFLPRASARIGDRTYLTAAIRERSDMRILIDTDQAITSNSSVTVSNPPVNLSNCEGSENTVVSSAATTFNIPAPRVPPVIQDRIPGPEIIELPPPPRQFVRISDPVRDTRDPLDLETSIPGTQIIPRPTQVRINPINPAPIDSRTLMPSLTTVPAQPRAGINFRLTINGGNTITFTRPLPIDIIRVSAGSTINMINRPTDLLMNGRLTGILNLPAGTYDIIVYNQSNDPRTIILRLRFTVDPLPKSSSLNLGSSGDDVKKLQEDLISLGFLPLGGATGSFDVPTKLAVDAFQESKEWNPSGKVGYYTSLAIEEDLAKLATPLVTPQSQNGSLPPAITPKPGLFPISIPTPGVSQEPVIDIAPIDNPMPQATPTTETTPTLESLKSQIDILQAVLDAVKATPVPVVDLIAPILIDPLAPAPILDPTAPLMPISPISSNVNNKINLLASLIDKMRELLGMLK